MIDVITQIISVFILLLAILDPFMAAPPFLAMTRKMKEEEREKILRDGVIIAGVILAIVMLIGTALLDLFGISIQSFQIAGGILIFILGTQIVLGQEIVKTDGKKKKESKDTIALLLGTPLLAGPASITTMILVAQTYGIIIPSISLVLTLIATYIIMHLGNKLVDKIGSNTLDATSKFMGLILAAFGIEFIKKGVLAIIQVK